MSHTVDMSKVKKSPVPKGDAGVNYYRGGGIKIHVYEERMHISDDTGRHIATREGDYTETATGEIKKLAAAMLNKAEQDSKPFTEIGHTHPVKDERTENWGTTRKDVSVKVPKVRIAHERAEPAFRQTFGFLTSGRTALA